MCHLLLAPIYKLKHHRVGDMQSRKLIESTWWHEDFSAMVNAFSFGPRQHDHGVAAVVFVEAGGGSAGHTTKHGGRIHAVHHVVVIHETGVELGVSMSDGLSDWLGNDAYHGGGRKELLEALPFNNRLEPDRSFIIELNVRVLVFGEA